MNIAKRAGAALALSALVILPAAAQDAEPASAVGCMHMDKQVSEALAAHANAPKAFDAKTQQRVGQNMCMIGQYKAGLDGYAKALQLLGAN